MATSNWDATEVAAFIALGGVLISASVAYVTASRSVYVNAVTAARIKWIEKIRDLIIDFRELHFTIAMLEHDGKEVEHKDAMQLNRLKETMALSLGRSSNELHILRLTLHCLGTTDHYDTTLKYSDLLANHAKWLLETEWRRVKHEASNPLLVIVNKTREFSRETEYQYFVQGAGAYADLAHKMPVIGESASASPGSAALP